MLGYITSAQTGIKIVTLLVSLQLSLSRCLHQKSVGSNFLSRKGATTGHSVKHFQVSSLNGPWYLTPTVIIASHFITRISGCSDQDRQFWGRGFSATDKLTSSCCCTREIGNRDASLRQCQLSTLVCRRKFHLGQTTTWFALPIGRCEACFRQCRLDVIDSTPCQRAICPFPRPIASSGRSGA